MTDARNATPAETLKRRIMDPCIPKSEAEHWAAREIEKQRAEIEGLRAQLDERYIAMRVRQLEHALDAEREAVRRLREALEGKP